MRSASVLLVVAAFFATPGFAQSSKTSQKKTAEENFGPKEYSSPNFHLVTDLGDKGAEELLGRLEVMIKFVSGYFGRKNPRTIDMYVAKNIASWPEAVTSKMDPEGIQSIRNEAGVTLGVTRRSGATGRAVDAMAVVYAIADHGTPQHEAVHAYCILSYGTAGPVWYAEGMAEVGQYWRADEKGVNAHDVVVDFLKQSKVKPIKEIVDNPLETTGDSWQNYASRWALCHLLGFNENYTQRFKPLGLSLLAEQRDVSFWSVYGTQAKEIDFEYRQFLKDLEPGYRVDLCSWDWKARGKTLKGKASHKAQVKAGRGWQPAKIHVTPGTEYSLDITGEWKLSKDGEPIGAGGDDEGNGKLTGILFNDYTLSEPFEIGDVETFSPPGEGDLFLRCADAWGSLGDNSGTLSLTLKLADGK